MSEQVQSTNVNDFLYALKQKNNNEVRKAWIPSAGEVFVGVMTAAHEKMLLKAYLDSPDIMDRYMVALNNMLVQLIQPTASLESLTIYDRYYLILALKQQSAPTLSLPFIMDNGDKESYIVDIKKHLARFENQYPAWKSEYATHDMKFVLTLPTLAAENEIHQHLTRLQSKLDMELPQAKTVLAGELFITAIHQYLESVTLPSGEMFDFRQSELTQGLDIIHAFPRQVFSELIEECNKLSKTLDAFKTITFKREKLPYTVTIPIDTVLLSQ
jgi:hypothetical protein